MDLIFPAGIVYEAHGMAEKQLYKYKTKQVAKYVENKYQERPAGSI